MRIYAQFDGRGWSIDPNVAQVRLGESVEWVLRAEGLQQSPLIVWTVYFDQGSPFGPVLSRFTTTTAEDSDQHHDGVTGPVFPGLPGDYKYGLRITDAATQKVVAEEDPWLHVTT